MKEIEAEALRTMAESAAFISKFEDIVATSIDERGIYPAPMLVEYSDGGLDMMALALEPLQCYSTFALKVLDRTVKHAIFGLDRSTKENQGTEFADVLTCVAYHRNISPEVVVREQFAFGVINYQHEPRIIRPIDFKNAFWIAGMKKELFQFIPNARITRSK